MVAAPGADEPLGVHFLTTAEPEAVVELPAPGEYDLWVRPLYQSSGSASVDPALSLSARGLNLNAVDMPAPVMPDFGEFAVLEAPMDLQIWPGSSRVYISQIAVNGQVIFETDDPRFSGGRRDLHIDPAQLDDGFYVLEVEGTHDSAPHRSYAYRTFMVDAEDQFADLARSHWARQPVELMAHMGILSGRAEGVFDPDTPVLRKEFAKMVALTFELPEAGGPSPFADAPGDWSQPYIDALYEAGLVQGEVEEDGQRYFRPDRQISRAEAVTIIGRALGIESANVSMLPPVFVDDAAVPGWAWRSVAVLSVWRWVSGFPEGDFRAGASFTRAQAAKLLALELGLDPGLRDSGAVRPPGIGAGWMHQWGWPPRVGFNPFAVMGAEAEPLWESNVAPAYSGNAVLGHGLLFVTMWQGRIAALLPDTGQVLWRTRAGNHHGATLAYSPEHNLLYASVNGSETGKVVALHPVTGRIVWEAGTPGQHSLGDYSPVVAGDLVIVGAHGSGSTLFAFDARTGEQVWFRGSLGSGPISVYGGLIFHGNTKGQVMAYRGSDGALVWERRNGWSGGSPPVVGGHGLVFVSDSFDRQVFALNAATGAVVWQRSGMGQVAVDEQYVWVPMAGGGYAVVDPATGEEAATVPVCASALLIGATHAFTACSGQILAIDRETYAVTPVAPGPAVWALDGDRLYYTFDDAAPGTRFLLGALVAGAAPAPGSPRVPGPIGSSRGRYVLRQGVSSSFWPRALLLGPPGRLPSIRPHRFTPNGLEGLTEAWPDEPFGRSAEAERIPTSQFGDLLSPTGVSTGRWPGRDPCI